MEQDLLHDWDDTPADEKKALEVVSSHHHLVYHMLNGNIDQNLSIIREHCKIPPYHEKQISSAATPKESNDRILKFLEERYSHICNYDEFFVVLRKLIEMPEAMTIIDSFQKKINECFEERRAKEKLKKEADGASAVSKTATSSTGDVTEKETSTVKNGFHDHPQPSPPTAEAETGDNDDDDDDNNPQSAKKIISGIVTEVLHSTPGFHILQSYKERVCESLPSDYNTTAIRLQPLIGASDHMIEWILTGDMSQVNHRIYQVVLVFVCFEPHFIKFCDIMKVLAAGSMTVGYIVELRQNLIKHLYSDGHITAEEASQLSAKKLFEEPAMPTATAPPINLSSATPSTGISTASTTTVAANYDSFSSTFGLLQGINLKSPPTTGATATASSTVNIFTNQQSTGLAAMPQLSPAQLGTTVVGCQPSITVTPNIPVALSIATFPSSVSVKNVPAGPAVTTSHTAVTADDDTTSGSTTKANKTTDTAKLTTTTRSVTTSRGSSPVATVKVNNTVPPSDRDVKKVEVVLTQAAPSLGSSDQSTIDRMIDSIVDNNVLSLNGIAQFLLSPQHERSVILMQAVNKVNEKSAAVSTQALPQVPGGVHITTGMEDKQKRSGFDLLNAKYAEILACFPENYEGTINYLQSHLSDEDMCIIFSSDSGHNQRILDCLVQKVRMKEDFLDFCDNLEKIPGAPPLLTLIVEQIRKEVIEELQMMASPVKSTGSLLEDYEMTSLPPIALPKPKVTILEDINPFEGCPLPEDSKGLAVLKQTYPSLLKSLSSNHLTSLTRLQNVATVPEDKVDSIMTAPNSDIGNEMILSYLIGLIQTENDIIGFCNIVEKMIGDPQKCECVSNLRSAVSAPQQQPTDQTVSTRDDDTKKPASPSTDASVPLPTKTAEMNDAVSLSDDDLKKPAEASEHDDVAVDKPAEPSVSGESVVSEKDTKEHSEMTSQTESTEATTSAVVTLSQQPGPKLSDNTQAALKAFNAYRPQLHALDAVEVGDQLISFELISPSTHSGGDIHLPNQVKMDLILPQIEQKISLGGPEMFFKLITALSQLPSSYELSTQLKVAYQGYRQPVGAGVTAQSSQRAQQVIPMSVLPPADQPRHAVDSHSSVISQQTVGDSQRMVAMASATASSSVPVTSVAVASTKTQEPALVKCTDDTAGAMVSFDEHLPLVQSKLNPFVIIPKCISYGVIRGDVTATVGPGPPRTNAEKLEILVQELRNIVFQKGIESFKRILYVIRTEKTFVEVADEIERGYEIYKDPVARQKRQQLIDNKLKKAPATKVDPVNTQAALEAFDEYYDLARDHIEVEPFTMNCVGFGVIAEISPFTGASIFLPQYLRMDNVLRLIRSNIALNGKSTLLLMIRIIDKMGNCQLAGFFEKVYKNRRETLEAQRSLKINAESKTAVTTTSEMMENMHKFPVTTSGIYQQTGLRKLQTVTNANTTPGEVNMDRINRIKAMLAAKKAAEAAEQQQQQQQQQQQLQQQQLLQQQQKQQQSSEPSVQQSTSTTTGISEVQDPKPQPDISHLVEKGLQPPSLPENYVCRPKLLNELVQKMLSNKPDPSSLSVAATITGASGFGKTTLAKALCHDAQVIKCFKDGFLFIELGPKSPNPISTLTNLYLHLTSKQFDQDDIEALVMELRHTTGAYFHNLLVILDDVCEANDAKPYVKAFSNCSIILTTQLSTISEVIPARVELRVSKMEMDEAMAVVNGATNRSNDVSIVVSDLADNLQHCPLLLSLVKCQVSHSQKQQPTSEDGAISTTKRRLQEKGLSIHTNSTSEDQRTKAAVKACVDLSLEMIGDGLTEKLIMYVLFTGIGYSLSTDVVHWLWQVSKSDAEEVVQSLLSCGLIHLKTSHTKETSIVVHAVIAQYLLDNISATKLVQLGTYKGPSIISIDAAIDGSAGITLPSEDLEYLKVILSIVDNAELPCRLRKLSSVAVQSPRSLTSIIQEFDKQCLSLPEYEEIKTKFQNTIVALVDECSEISAITVQSAISLNTDVYKVLQTGGHDSLIKSIELLCRTNLIGEVASKFVRVLNDIMTVDDDELFDKMQSTFEQIQIFEPECNNNIVIEFAQIKLVIELRKRITGALTSNVDTQINEACQYVKSGALAEKLKKVIETHQSKSEET